MTAPVDPAPFDAQATYDAASRDYEDASREYWQYLSRRAVEALSLTPGERVLDAPCGTGPAAIAAAADVGPGGHVLGVDFAPAMLAIAREKVAGQGLGNVELRQGDMMALGLPPGSFDAVASILGIFFIDDMAAAVRALWDLVRPGGGRLVVAVLGRAFFDPVRDVFVHAVAEVRPGFEVVEPWRRTEDPTVLRRVMADAGVGAVELTSAADTMPLPSPADWWRIVLGTGLRRTVMGLEPAEADAVRQRCDRWIAEHGVREVVLDTHVARAVKA